MNKHTENKLHMTDRASACSSAVFITGGYTVAMFAGVGITAVHNLPDGVNIAAGLAMALFIFVLGAGVSFVTRNNADQTVKEWFDVWALAGTRNLRRTFQVCASCTADVAVCHAVMGNHIAISIHRKSVLLAVSLRDIRSGVH